MSAIAVAATAAATVVACASQTAPNAIDMARTVDPGPPAAAAVARTGANTVTLPPNADGDPPCPVSDAWGTNPFGPGIVVTYLSDDTEPVTVLVRTQTGSDRAQHTSLGPGELRLFEFADVDQASVSEVLIMTNTRRCYASADPAARG